MREIVFEIPANNLAVQTSLTRDVNPAIARTCWMANGVDPFAILGTSALLELNADCTDARCETTSCADRLIKCESLRPCHTLACVPGCYTQYAAIENEKLKKIDKMS
jgi:hypothetical protein